MNSDYFAYVWQYTIKPDRRQEYLAAYRPNGTWAKLFSQDPGYLRTELLNDSDQTDRYMTVDYWKSKAARDSFRERYTKEFARLDLACEEYTNEERFIGDYVVVVDDAT